MDLSHLGETSLDQSFDPIDAGTYAITVEKFETKVSAAGNEYLAATFKVVGGQYDGRLLWDQFNLAHPDAGTKEISNRRIGNLFAAAGFKVACHTDRLIGETVGARVAIRPETAQYPAKNVIKNFSTKKGLPDGKSDGARKW